MKNPLLCHLATFKAVCDHIYILKTFSRESANKRKISVQAAPHCTELCSSTMKPSDVSLLGDDGASDELFHDLIGASVDGLYTGVHKRLGDGVFPHVAPASMELQALICHPVLEV